MQPESGPAAASKVRLLTLDHLDNRTAAAKRCRELIAAIELDLGGKLTAAERELVKRAAITGALIEDLEARALAGEVVDPALVVTLGNAQRRLLGSLQRKQRDIAPAAPASGEEARLVQAYQRMTMKG